MCIRDRADTLGENNLADCTGFENNERIGELSGNSFYLSNDNLSPESLSEEDAADLQAMKDSLPELASNLVLYTPIENTAQGLSLIHIYRSPAAHSGRSD